MFLALDRPEDVKKLLSLELTGVWVNEAREIPKSIIDACTMRVGRYPSMRDGGASWYGVIADTNAPEEDHWWAIMSGDVPVPDHISREEALMLIKPDNWSFHTQPPALLEKKDKDGMTTAYDPHDKAENKKNITPEYYPNIIRGKTKGWIDVYVLNKLGSIEEGKPVYHSFKEELHITKNKIDLIPGQPIWIGVDFGLTPAAVFGQRTTTGKWNIINELVCFEMGVIRFSELLRGEIAKLYKGYEVMIYGDPAGDFRSQTDERTPFQIMRNCGLKAIPAPSNDVALRIEAVDSTLSRLVDGSPGFTMSTDCINLKKGFNGGYHYRRLQTSGDRYDEKPFLIGSSAFKTLKDDIEFQKVLGVYKDKNVSRVEAWKQDIDYFVYNIRQSHFNMHHSVSKENFDTLVNDVKSNINTLTDQQVIVKLMKILGSLGNGHNLIIPTTPKQNALKQLPIQFYQFKDGMYIVSAKKGFKK